MTERPNSVLKMLAWAKYLIYGKEPEENLLEEIQEQLNLFFYKQYKLEGKWLRTAEIMNELEDMDKYHAKEGYVKIAAYILEFSQLFRDVQDQIYLGEKNISKIKQKILEAHVVIEKKFPKALNQIAEIRDIRIPQMHVKLPKETKEYKLIVVALEYLRHAKAQIRLIKEIADRF